MHEEFTAPKQRVATAPCHAIYLRISGKLLLWQPTVVIYVCASIFTQRATKRAGNKRAALIKPTRFMATTLVKLYHN